jgi:hypothetical protein
MPDQTRRHLEAAMEVDGGDVPTDGAQARDGHRRKRFLATAGAVRSSRLSGADRASRPSPPPATSRGALPAAPR